MKLVLAACFSKHFNKHLLDLITSSNGVSVLLEFRFVQASQGDHTFGSHVFSFVLLDLQDYLVHHFVDFSMLSHFQICSALTLSSFS